jgi:PIN domain nuclease of toxin-antitoxin system
MKLLVDTCTFLWMADDAPELSARAREAVTNPTNEVYFSAASAWEITIKYALGKLPLPEPPGAFVPTQREQLALTALAIEEESVLALDRLPSFHRDPFDRLLVCQAITHGLVIVSPDPKIQQYPVRTLW